MYMRYAEKMRWKTELMGASISDFGGFKEVVLLVEGKGRFQRLQYESGVHRVRGSRKPSLRGGFIRPL